jgi:hypothetical protein
MASMTNFDVKIALPQVGIYSSANSAASAYSGAAIDLQPYVNAGGRAGKAFLDVSAITSTGTLVVTIEESSTTGVAGFAPIATFAGFTGAQTTATTQSTLFVAAKRYVRAKASITDTGNMALGVYAVLEKRLA